MIEYSYILITLNSTVHEMLRTMKNKEVFVKHDKAPTAPRFEGGI